MRQEIHTFPLWDSLQSQSECPFCEVLEETEDSYISGMFRDMVNDRTFIENIKNNKFCSNHFAILTTYRDKFGLALLLERLISLEMEDLKSFNIKFNAPPIPKNNIQRMMEKFISSGPPKVQDKPTPEKCHLCEYLRERENDFLNTLISLWGENLHFRALYHNSNGFCLGHFYKLVEFAPAVLDGDTLDNFIKTSLNIQLQSMARISEDIGWFIKKFNYHYRNEPWKNAKDSLIRGISKVAKAPVNSL